MFYCMDEVDKAYVRALFPSYLLEQPIGHQLWKIYYRNRKLFRKLKSKGEGMPNFRDPRLRRLRPELSYETRKEIWEKLMSLGVLGTIPYDAASDEYLVHVYQYFYPEIDGDPQFGAKSASDPDEMQVDSDVHDLTNPVFISRHEGRHSMNGIDYEDDDDDGEFNDDDVAEDNDEDDSNESEDDSNDEDGDEDEDGEDNDGNVDEDDDHEAHVTRPPAYSQRSADDGSTNHDIEFLLNEADPIEGRGLVDSSQEVQSKPSEPKANSDSAANSESINFKRNTVSQEIYKHLGYPLPHVWETPSNNSILVSSDGCTQLKSNPEFQALSAHDRRTSSIVGSGFPENLSGFNARQEYVSTMANSATLSKSLAVFYYEIRILPTRPGSSPSTSRIKIGFRDISKIQSSSKSSSRTDLQVSDPNSINRQAASIVRATLDTTSSSSSTSRGDNLYKGCFLYGGQDGNITDGALSKTYSNGFGQLDVIGCGVNYVDGTIFFTKNGVHLGTAFTDIHDIDVLPFVSLTAGSVIRTNFGLYEEFVFDILGYQRRLKAKAYQHIYKSIDGHDGRDDFSPYDDQRDVLDNESDANPVNEGIVRHKDGFLLQNDDRISGDQLFRPDVENLNNLNIDDDSIPCTMNTMINDYLIHEGLIDVAKGFLIDLNKDCIPNNEEERARMVIRHNERQIVKEETNLKVRQDIRRLINEGEMAECVHFIESHYPGLLESSIDVFFELKVAEYLLAFVNFKKHTIDDILALGQELTARFVYSPDVPAGYKEAFQNHLNDISSLLAYDNPLEECSEDLAVFLTPAYLQDRLFQLINSRVLVFLKKKSESSLENMVSYTRAMINALMEYGEGSSLVHNDSELRVHKLINIDEDLLSL
ncbi:LAME_0H20208g1_1 [Lachancea meyersii CBS 8951]|uniref:LAME_0H20208g1_1 n=1 Tax=Lachancea meyersii CBS 8951 TaxID=1266667 RepID=A0A1G4KJJ8_9SACH|nr:LAME_0H20208g1_1 [Lachancea meyersii CBS 8951]